MKVLVDSINDPAMKFKINDTNKAIINLDTEVESESGVDKKQEGNVIGLT